MTQRKKRTYKQACHLAFASDLIGDRWVLLIIRELMVHPCRYKQLQRYLKGMGSNLLADRLKELTDLGFIEPFQPGKAFSGYQLTQRGWSLKPVVFSLVRWGISQNLSQEAFLTDGNDVHFAHWDLLAAQALFNPGRAVNVEQRLWLDWRDITGSASIISAKGALLCITDQQLNVSLLPENQDFEVQKGDLSLSCLVAQLKDQRKTAKLKQVLSCFDF